MRLEGCIAVSIQGAVCIGDAEGDTYDECQVCRAERAEARVIVCELVLQQAADALQEALPLGKVKACGLMEVGTWAEAVAKEVERLREELDGVRRLCSEYAKPLDERFCAECSFVSTPDNRGHDCPCKRAEDALAASERQESEEVDDE